MRGMHINPNFNMNELCDEVINSSLAKTIEKYHNGAMVMLELPVENYVVANSSSVKFLTENGFEGIYVSFQRPFENIKCLFEEYGIDKDKVTVLDYASFFCENENADQKNYVDISSMDFKIIGEAIADSLKKIDCKNKFVLIDSLSTVALYKDGSEVEELAKNLIGINDDNLLILLNIAEDLVKKQYVKDITSYADEVINLLSCVEKYSRDVVGPHVLT